MSLRALYLAFSVLFLTLGAANAQEQINAYDVVIDVEQDGDIIVTETINVTVEGRKINRGIFRDLPRYFEKDGARYEYNYTVRSIRRDGKPEPYERSDVEGAVRLRIGDADYFLPHGKHEYEITYLVKNQIRYFDNHDELYWNVTGNFWNFPILSASATVNLPDGARVTDVSAYTGAAGRNDTNYRHTSSGNTHVFKTTKPLASYEGMTISLSMDKGIIDPPSVADKNAMLWQRYGALGLLLASLLGVLGYYYRSFDKFGRDPPKPPVFARYEPPADYSPAAVHHIYHRTFSGHSALIATLMDLAVKKWLDIDVQSKNSTVLTKRGSSDALGILAEDEGLLMRDLYDNRTQFTLGEKFNADFTAAYTAFKSRVSKKYGKSYFRWNFIYVIMGLVFSAIGVALVVQNTVSWTLWHTLGLLALAALNGLFMYLMPAPTKKGQKIRTEIEGFRLYMETAEKLQLNAVKVGGESPPPMTTARYEKFLPYAVALGVEKPWTKHFERLLPEEARAYNPGWASLRHGGGSIGGINKAIIGSLSSGVTSSLPQSSSSSGSGGGGFSGGGGGGGGGGGW